MQNTELSFRKVENKLPKILFYAGTSYGFRAWAIWEVYKISQEYPIVVLSEKLDLATEKLLNNKSYFPHLQKIIYFKNNINKIIRNNSKVHRELQEIISEEKPNIAIDCGKYVYLLNLYFRRISRRAGAKCITYLGIQPVLTKELAKWKLLMNAYSADKSILFTKIRKIISHILVYYLLPIFVFEKPFLREPGGIILKECFSASSDYYVCFSEREYQLCLEEGADERKLFFISDPYPSEYERIRKEGNPFKKDNNKALILIWSQEKIGIKKSDLSKISEQEIKNARFKIIKIISSILNEWKIYVKPHPSTSEKEFIKFKNLFFDFKNVQVAKPLESADDYTQICDVFVGMPPVSSTSYTASLSCPGKPILCVNFDDQLMGDACKDLNGVEYISNEVDFIKILKEIKDNKYSKKITKPRSPNLHKGEISNTIELIDKIFKKND